MKMLIFAALFLCTGAYASAQQVTLLEDGAGGAAKNSAAAEDGMPQVSLPKDEIPAAAVPAPVPVSPSAASTPKKTEKRVVNKKKKNSSIAASSSTVKIPAAQVTVKPAAPNPAVEQAPPAAAGAGFSVGKTHTVIGGDTLWDLSSKYYKDPYRWGKIYNANLGTVNNPDLIYPKEELVIPDLTEEVKPEAGKSPVITGGETVKEAQLAGSDVIQAPAASAPASAAPSAKTAQTELSEMLKDFDSNDLSEEMPVHQKEWSASVKIVPESWQQDGVVSAAVKGEGERMENSLSETGDILLVSMTGQAAVKKGDYLSVYMKGSTAYDKAGNKLGQELQLAGTVQVLSADGPKVRARVIETQTAIIKGYVVKRK